MVFTDGIIKIGEFLQHQHNHVDVQFSDESFLQLSVIVGEANPQVNFHNDNLERQLSDGTDLGRDILANIGQSPGKDYLRVEQPDFDEESVVEPAANSMNQSIVSGRKTISKNLS